MSNTIIKKEFVRRVLQDEGERFERSQGLALRKYLTFHTGETEKARLFKVTSADNMDGMLSITTRAHVRFLDIKKKTRTKSTRKIKRINRPIYNRFAFGHYYSIAARLMYDLTDDVVETIKKDLNQIS